MLERAKEVTLNGEHTRVEYARYADDLVVLVDGHPRHEGLRRAINRRLREELGKLHVEVNEEKSRTVDMTKGEGFGYLGFEHLRVLGRSGKWWPQQTPKLKKRTALLRKLKVIFRRFRSQPVDRVIQLINPILRGWVAYFAIGHSSRCFNYVKLWVEQKVRRHMMRAMKRSGFGWKRWSTQWLRNTLGLFNDYRVRLSRPRPKALPA